MLKLAAILLACSSLLSPAAFAKGSGGGEGGSSSRNKTVHVNGYRKADGKWVEDYDRAAPDAASHYNAATCTYSSTKGFESEGGSFSAAEVAAKKQSPAVAAPPVCFKPVMTDEEIGLCKAHDYKSHLRKTPQCCTTRGSRVRLV